MKDVNFAAREVTVRGGKGSKDRRTMLPVSLVPELEAHLRRVKKLHARDLARGGPCVALPDALAIKYPNASRDWRWQWLFPASRVYQRKGEHLHHHLHETVLQRGVAEAVRASGVSKRASCHTFRHSFATHLLQAGYDVRTIQELLAIRTSGRR